MSPHCTRANIVKTIGETTYLQSLDILKVGYINMNLMLKAFGLWVFLCLISPAEFCGFELVDTWRLSKSTWSLVGQVTWKSRWGSFIQTHNPTKFDDHWRFDTGDAPFCEYNMITWQMSHVKWWVWTSQLLK